MNYLVIVFLVLAIVVTFYLLNKREGLALSQFPSCIRPSPFLDANVATFDSSSTFQRYYQTIPPFPRVTGKEEVIADTLLNLVSEADVKAHLDGGGTIVVAENAQLAAHALNEIVRETAIAGRQGYPYFYNIPGPIVVMNKVGKDYYWMIGYPISYIPANISKFVNMNDNWNVAKKAYHVGLRNLQPTATMVFLK